MVVDALDVEALINRIELHFRYRMPSIYHLRISIRSISDELSKASTGTLRTRDLNDENHHRRHLAGAGPD
jgi:hypothetical protein